MTNFTKLTALAIILNEEDNLRDYLKNMSFADEIIVVDSFSTDQSLHIIATEFPHVKIFQRKFDDFSSQKNYAIELASHDWIMFFDADERISEKGIDEIKNVINDGNNIYDAFWIKRIFYYSKKNVFYGGRNQDKAIRLFRKSKCRYSKKLVHEELIVNGNSSVLKEAIHHYSLKNKNDFLKKRLLYSQLKAQELYALNKKPNIFHFYIKPCFRFFKHYILELGILNGFTGITLSKIMAYHVYMRYVFLKEMHQNEANVVAEKSLKIGYEAKRIFHNKTGLGNYSRDLIRVLSEFYPENNYLLYNPKLKNNKLFIPNNKNVFEKQPTTWLNTTFYNIWRQFNVLKDLKNDKIQLFHGLSGEIPFGLKKNKIKSVVTIHDLIFIRYPQFYSFFDRKIHYYKFKKAVKDADWVIAISEQTKKDIVQFFNISSDKISVVYQGCQDVFKQDYTLEEKNKVAKKHRLPKEYLLNVGTVEERKNVLAVVKAIKNIDTHLVIVGGITAYTTEVLNYIKENKMESKVLFIKNLNSKELAIIYQLATLFVYTSIFEGFGIPIIEALYSKTPVIASKNGVFPEAGGPDSIYIDSNNIEEIEGKIIYLLSNPILRLEIAAQGHQFVQKFNDQNIANEVMKVYKTLLNF